MFDWIRKRYHYGRYAIVKEMLGAEGRKHLDIGCGTPCECIEDFSFLDYIGGGYGIDIIMHEPRDGFTVASVTSLPFKEKSFEVVTALEMLEHIHDVDTALDEISRTLGDDGIFFFSSPTNNILWRTVWFFWVRSAGKMWAGDHITNLRERQWIETLERLFTVEEKRIHWGVDLILKLKKRRLDGR